jgi:hypothetical protein
MQKGHNLQFPCLTCKTPIRFSVFNLDKEGGVLQCSSCSKPYILSDEALLRQLKKFEALCQQIKESEEILGNTNVGVDVGEHHVKIPYKLLLTRLNSSLDLLIGGQPVSITFRIEPSRDVPSDEENQKIR